MERVKQGGFSFTVWQGHSQKWYAGAEGSRGDTRSAAIAAHLRYARAEKRKDVKAAKKATSEALKLSKKRACSDCGGMYASLSTHYKTKTHKNMVAWNRHQRSSRY